jgi:transcriptional regulator with XRE-family HTH domain
MSMDHFTPANMDISGPESTRILSENIADLMKAAGLTQDRLGKRSSLSQATIGRILRSESSTTIDSLFALAEAFKLQPWQLLISLSETRRLRLRQWIDEQHGGSEIEFLLGGETDRPELDQWLSGATSINEMQARELERHHRMPAGWLDNKTLPAGFDERTVRHAMMFQGLPERKKLLIEAMATDAAMENLRG